MQVYRGQPYIQNKSKCQQDPYYRAYYQSIQISSDRFKQEYSYWDLKDSKLYIFRVKLKETLIEAYSSSNI